MVSAELLLSVRELRRLFKPQKERLSRCGPAHPTCIRFHRACSWLQCVEEASQDGGDVDNALIDLWIALNALYGRWDSAAMEPEPDREGLRHFLDQICRLDRGDYLGRLLKLRRPLVERILDDKYLHRHFWKSSEANSGRRMSERGRANRWYGQREWKALLKNLLHDRIYLLRCQLIHGAATHNSKVNREAVRNCARMLEDLVRTFLRIFAEHGALEHWGDLCYPPQNAS